MDKSPDSWSSYYRFRRFLRLAGMRIRYIDVGDGDPVLLLHGIGHSSLGWKHNLPGLVDAGYRVIAVDTPGFGYSDRPPASSLGRFQGFITEFILELLDTMCLDSCHLAGHSLGGAYAATFAIDHPERVRRLVLAAPALGPRVSFLLRLLTLHVAGALPRPTPRQLRGTLARFAVDPGWLDEEEIAEFQRWLALPGSQQWFLTLLRTGLRLRGVKPEQLLVHRLAQLKAPTLVIWGRRDRILPVVNGPIMAEQISDCRLEVIDDAGHMVTYEKSKRFNELAIEFFNGWSARP